ncbi:MAG: PocR ligand-binding domain-containing protein [Desulfuromonadales bacterium]|nr:PocR ligand-binding domain-containing protein [Desulfuromonadales bacterium]
MTHRDFAELINTEELQSLCEQFTRLTGFVTAILDMEGNVLVATGWREICTRFHRSAPASAVRCHESDTMLASRLREGDQFCMYRCGNGLVDVAVPVVVDGKQVGRLYSGQFLLEPPDMAFFRAQAAEFGFDESPYLEAVRKVPVVTEERVRLVMDFLCRLAEMIGEAELANRRARNNGLIAEESPAVLFRWKAAEGWPVSYVSNNVVQFGYTAEAFMSGVIRCSALLYPEDIQRITLEIQQYLSSGVDRFQLEHRIITRDGDIRWVSNRMVVERDAEGTVTHYRGVVLDISERKRTEEALRISERRYRDIVEGAPVGIFRSTPGGKLLAANPALARILKYASPEELIQAINQKSVADVIFVDLERWQSVVSDSLNSDAWNIRQEPFRCKDGSIVILNFYHRVVPGTSGDSIEFEGFGEDITEAKRAVEALRESKERLRASLAEKNVLLHEIHHRVKNNMMIVNTLLDIQADSITDAQTRSFFRECQNRISSLAQVHEQLYRSRDFASVDLAEYIGNLASRLFSSFVKDPERVILKVNAERISMNIDQSIPCGMIVNELVSNSLKYAFPGARKGEIDIRLNADPEGWISLTVADNGVGLPEEVDIRNTQSLGLQLVDLLVRQLGGHLEHKNDGGASFLVRFRKKEED